jgi:hypothetical protein
MPSTPNLPDGYQLLSHYTRTVIGCVRNVAVPAEWSISLNSESDVIVKSEERSTWAALRMVSPTSCWSYTKGTVGHLEVGAEWDDLAAAVAAITAEQPSLADIAMIEATAFIASGEAGGKAISVIAANLDTPDFELTLDLFQQIFAECSVGELVAVLTVLAATGASLAQLLGDGLGVPPSSLLQPVARPEMSYAVSQLK